MATATPLPFGDRVRHPVNFEFLGAGPAAVARRPLVLLHHPPLRRAAVDHSRRRARAGRHVRLADRRGSRNGDRGGVHHHLAQGRWSQRAPLRQPTRMVAPRQLLGGPLTAVVATQWITRAGGPFWMPITPGPAVTIRGFCQATLDERIEHRSGDRSVDFFRQGYRRPPHAAGIAEFGQLDCCRLGPGVRRADSVNPDLHAVDIDFDRGEREELLCSCRRYRKHGDRNRGRVRLIRTGLRAVHRDSTDFEFKSVPPDRAGPRAERVGRQGPSTARGARPGPRHRWSSAGGLEDLRTVLTT